MLAGPYDGYMKAALDELSERPGGGLLNILAFVMKGGAAQWGDDVTYTANDTIKQPTILADTFTVNAGVTLTTTPLMPLMVIADTFDVAGVITASGKGCQTSGCRIDPAKLPIIGAYQEEVSGLANCCLCGAGGASGSVLGGGAFGPSLMGAQASSCDLSAAELRQLLLSPLFLMAQIGCGGRADLGGVGGGSILLVGRVITLAATASLLANGLNHATYGGGGAGFIGLAGDTVSVHGSATLSASGGTSGGSGEDGGDGAIAQIEV